MAAAAAPAKTEHTLVSQGLETLSEEFIKEHGSTAVKLDLSSNKIKNAAWLSKFPKLETLILDHNGIESLSSLGFPLSKTIKTLWLNNNKISDSKSFLDSILSLFPEITYLSVLKNPMTPDMYFSDGEAEAYQRFRYYAIHRLRKLEFLDATEIDSLEKKEAERIGHLMATAKPSAPSQAGAAEDSEATAYNMKKSMKDGQGPKVATFLVKSRPRYDGSNSEGNRFITNDAL